MDRSRRSCWLSAPALVIAVASSVKRVVAAQSGALISKTYRFDELPVHRSSQNNARPILQRLTHSGWLIELHESDLVPSGMPHPPHHHVHEEMFLVREGTLEVTIAGRTTRLGPGSVAFVASNEEHGIRNGGTERAQYFVLALGRD